MGGYVYSEIASGTLTTTITNSTFTANGLIIGGFRNGETGAGGGVSIQQITSGTASATATLTNNTFFKNIADSDGGGIALFLTNTGTSTNTAALTSLTVNQNQAGTDSGGLYVSAAQNGVVSVDNCILSGNTVTAVGYKGPVDVTLTNNAALNDKGYNLVGTSNAMFTAKTDPPKNDNPGLENGLGTNNAKPGYPQTLAVQVGSPALGTGDPNLAGTIDERGLTRQPNKVSIGAEDPNAQ